MTPLKNKNDILIYDYFTTKYYYLSPKKVDDNIF